MRLVLLGDENRIVVDRRVGCRIVEAEDTRVGAVEDVTADDGAVVEAAAMFRSANVRLVGMGIRP